MADRAVADRKSAVVRPRGDPAGAASASLAFARVSPGALRVDRRFAKLLPPPANLDGLRESIRERGVLLPLLVTRDNLVLDGHSRLGIALELGLPEVPVIRLDVPGSKGWRKAVALLTNLHRRHLNEAQRVALVTSLRRAEEAAARERQRTGARAGGRIAGRGRARQAPGNGTPRANEEGRVAARLARMAGVSRKTFERAARVLDEAPDLAVRLLANSLSVKHAYSKLRRREMRARTSAESRARERGIYRGRLTAVPGSSYRTIVADPPWNHHKDGGRSASNHYRTMTVEAIEALDVGRLAHREGCHLWLWTTWPAIRDGAAHRVLAAWGFRWYGEVVWVKHRAGLGGGLRSRTEVCVLAVRGALPLLVDDEHGLIEARRRAHSEKPREVYRIIERCSPGPRVELFARAVPEGWDAWGNESRRAVPSAVR